ncbi:MAG: integrin alpha [Gammaproteobacteria bacterium]
MPHPRHFTPRRTLLASAVLAALGGTPHAWSQVLELSALNGVNGFKLSGVAAYDNSGIAVSGLGDVNGDGVADLLIGAHRASPTAANLARAMWCLAEAGSARWARRAYNYRP